MTYPDVSGLPVNLDTTYADDGSDASVKEHQQHHDLVHAAVKAGGAKLTYRAVAASTTAVAEEFIGVNATSGPATVTLPTAPAAGTRVGVKKLDASANVVTVDPPGAVTIDGDPTATLVAQWAGATFLYDGTNWLVHGAAYTGGAGGSTVTLDADGTLVVDGTTVEVATDAQVATDLAANATADRARANHTGTQTAATVSDFASAARAQTEAELIAGTNVTITPAGTGATRTLTIAASGGGGGGGSAGIPVSVRAGQYLTAPSGGAIMNDGLVGAVGFLRLVPLTLSRTVSVDGLRVEVVVAAASSTIRFGLYSSDADGYPGTLIAELGTPVDSSTTGIKNATFTAQSLAAGVTYFIAACQQGATGAQITASTQVIHGFGTVKTSNHQSAFQTNSGGVTGALPTTPAVLDLTSSIQSAPRILLKMVS